MAVEAIRLMRIKTSEKGLFMLIHYQFNRGLLLALTEEQEWFSQKHSRSGFSFVPFANSEGCHGDCDDHRDCYEGYFGG